MIYMSVMNTLRKPTASVTAAGVVAIIGSVLALLGATLAVLALFLMPESQGRSQIPPLARNLTAGAMALFAGLAIFGIFTGVGVLRLKNWARVSMLVCSGLTAAFCGVALAFMLFVPFPKSPNDPADMEAYIRVGGALVYGFPLAIAIWWLILFSRKGIAAQFVSAGVGSPVDASGFPVEMASAPRPTLPLPITVLAVFLMLPLPSLLFLFFVRMPMVLFGHAFHGPTGSTLTIVSGLVSTAAGIGLLYRKTWSYPLTLGLQVIGFLSGVVTLLSPKFPDLMREAMSVFSFSTPPPEYSIEQMRRMYAGGLIFPLLILVLLLYYRARFRQASSWRKPNA